MSSIMALWALPRCWAHLVGVSGGIKLHLKSIIIIKIYPARFAAIGGRDGMDCSRYLWMMYSINRTRHQSQVLGDRLRHWGRWVVIFINIHIYISSYSISMYISPFPVPQKRREWVDGGGQLWMTLLRLPFWEGSQKHSKCLNLLK